jgi:hypothetical protein
VVVGELCVYPRPVDGATRSNKVDTMVSRCRRNYSQIRQGAKGRIAMIQQCLLNS